RPKKRAGGEPKKKLALAPRLSLRLYSFH
ncbi:MAG: hypothetical protein ACI9KE_004147, partial [Polyangiales bacterium]